MTNINESPEEEIFLKIHNKTFLNKIAFNQYVKWNALSLKNFVDCRFEEIDFLGRSINRCKFKNSEFKNFSFRKCQFEGCTFENCQMVQLDFTRAEFSNCEFRNCEFLKSDLSASDFYNCEFSETRFKNTNLNFIIAQDVKLWKSNKRIDINDGYTFQRILADLNMASFDEE
jgi:uncharacterized protein YjbI with pentapeptide repeats